MTRRLTRLLFAAFILIVLSGCGEQKKEVRLVFKFPADKIYHFTYDNKTTVIIYENGAQTISNERSDRISYSQETTETIDSATSRLLFSYTQTNEDENSQNRWNTECIMASDGKIVEFFPDSNVSEESFEYYRRLFEQTSPIFPSELVPEGYSWSNRYKVLLDEGMTDAATTYKIRAFVREAGYDCAVIEYNGNMLIPLGTDPIGDGSVTVSGVDRVEVEGVTYFSYTKGILIRQEETSHLIRKGTQVKDNKTTSFNIEEERNTLTRLTDITSK